MRCEFIKAHRGEFGPIRKACEILHVSRSEYYDCLSRPKSNAQIEREALEGFVVEKFELHKGRYGYRRINWWRGECGHVYQMAVRDRVRAKPGYCPYCSGRKGPERPIRLD